MKNNKKFILAAGAAALGLVAATGVTSGFAWFATNATVGINNWSVTGKTSDPYLLIATDTDGTATPASIQSGHKIAIDMTSESVELDASALTAPTSPTILNSDYAGTASNWFTRKTSDLDASHEEEHMTAKQPLEAGNFSKYVKEYTFAVTVVKDTPKINGLRITSVTLPTFAVDQVTKTTGISVVITSQNGGVNYTSSSTTPTTLYTGDIDGDTKVQFKAFVYLNGEDDNVFTNNIAKLTGTLSFVIGTGTVA